MVVQATAEATSTARVLIQGRGGLAVTEVRGGSAVHQRPHATLNTRRITSDIQPALALLLQPIRDYVQQKVNKAIHNFEGAVKEVSSFGPACCFILSYLSCL